MDSARLLDTIQRALDSAGLSREPHAPQNDVRNVIDRALNAAGLGGVGAPSAPVTAKAGPARAAPPADPGEFLSRTIAAPQGRRDYRLYVPSSRDGSRPMPLVLMLHGCKQNPVDFAAGTRMNEHAERHGFLVAYPEQTARANGSNCWNWFERAQQSRDGPEPSILAGIVGNVGATHPVDARRVFVAGLSAGAAMAVILARTHPEVFAAVAAHSGLAAGAAHDVPSAFAAMQGRGAPARPASAGPRVRTLVFHGDADATVTPRNGAEIVRDAVAAFEQGGEALPKPVRREAMVNGRMCTTASYADASGRVLVEDWLVRGGAHAWFGGSAAGSYTDATGPDASAEMVRFFLGAPGDR